MFGLLNMPAVQEYAKNIVVDELKEKLGTELAIGKLRFQPFNSVELDSIYLYDQSNEKVLVANKLSASIDIYSLMKGDVIISSAWLSDFEIYLSKESSGSALNIQYIIDAFKPKQDSPPSRFDIKLTSVNIADGKFFYDVKDKPYLSDRFDANHIAVSDFEAKLSLKSLLSDSLNIQIKKFSLKEKSGLEVSNLVGRLLTQGKKASIKGFVLDLPSSTLELDKCEIDMTPPANDSLKLADYAKFDLVISSSHILPQDISSLAPKLRNFDDFVNIRGQVSGSVDNMVISDLSLNYGENLHLVSNLEIKDIRNKEKLYLLGSVGELTFTQAELENVINNFSDKDINLPSQLTNLGTISFAGDISGYLSQMTAFGSLETNLGVVNTDVLFGLNPRQGINSYIQGKVYTTDFNVGKLLANKDLNSVSLNIAVDLEKPVNSRIRGSADGDIFSIDYKDYTYRDIELDANYDGLRVDGSLLINDANGKLDIKGLFDLSDTDNPELRFKAYAENIQLDKLNISQDLQQSYLTLVVDADFRGKDIDSAEGYLRIDSIDFVREDKRFQMNGFMMRSVQDSLNHSIHISSDLLNGEITGQYSFASMSKSILKTLHPFLPALINIDEKKRPEDKENKLRFDFTLQNTDALSDILRLPVTLNSMARIKGNYNNLTDEFMLEASVPSIKAAGLDIRSADITAQSYGDSIHTRVDASIAGKKNVMNDISVNAGIKNNRMYTEISLVNDAQQKVDGSFYVTTIFDRREDEPLRVDLNIHPGELKLNNAVWRMNESNVIIQDGTYDVDNFFMATTDNKQSLSIDGKYSAKSPTDKLQAELKSIDLEYVFQTLAIDVLRFGGYATGSLLASSVDSKPYLNTHLDVTDFKFNGTELGNLTVFSELDEQSKKIVMDGLITNKENKKTTVSGSIDPVNQLLSMDFLADSIDISFLNTYAEAIFENVSGRGTGHVHMYGNFSEVTVEGKAFIEDGNIGVKMLNTNYHFTDTVYMKKDLIYFTDVALNDEFGNSAITSGKVSHDFFKNFMYMVDLSANNFLVYNATKTQNPLFYGKVFGSGKGTIGGDESVVDIDINMRTENNTVVQMNFMEDVVNEYSFINYKSQNQTDSIDSPALPNPIQTESGMEVNMKFYVDATPDAVVEIVMDPVGGDILRGSGNGAMQFEWSTKSSPKLYGTYHIIRGSYNFTFQRLLERRFTIEEGSTVQFSGDPFGAILDVTALYKITANLRDLDQYLVESTGQSTTQVNCVLSLTGQLRHPNVALDIRFPSIDPEVERQVKSLINTPDMINRQVAYLLLLSKFYSPQDANTPYGTSDFAAVASATLSNQLTKIVSQIDNRWQLGTNIRYSDPELSNTELELILSSRLLNDRLLINGNFGYRRDASIGREAMVTDVDIEYLLNNAGTWRVKAYNHYNEKFYYTGRTSQTQGVGIIYKKDFDSLSDLFRIPIKRNETKTDSIIPVIPDSTMKGSAVSHFIKLK